MSLHSNEGQLRYDMGRTLGLKFFCRDSKADTAPRQDIRSFDLCVVSAYIILASRDIRVALSELRDDSFLCPMFKSATCTLTSLLCRCIVMNDDKMMSRSESHARVLRNTGIVPSPLLSQSHQSSNYQHKFNGKKSLERHGRTCC